MEILKKDVIKEMEEKSRENLNRGIDISVSILKHEFPFITGWDYRYNPESFRLSIYLVLMADMNLASEFYSSPIRNVYKHAEARVAYPFSPLEISTELNEEEKYELFKVMQKSLVEIYDEIPSELRHEFESYSSEKKEPKELYIEGFIFEKPKQDINEAFDYEYYDKKYKPYKETPEDIEREWTRDELLDYGKNYYSAKFFKMFSPNVYKYATKKRWLSDIGRRLNWDEFAVEQRKIYGFFFECDGKKYVYIGLTKNVTERFESHFKFDMKKSTPFQRTVLGCGIEPEDVEFKVFTTEFLTDKEAGVYETELVAKYKQDPEYTVINVLPGAQMGRTSKKFIPEEIAKIIRIANIKDQNEFIRDYPEQYNYFKRTGRLGRVNELLGFRFFKQVRYNEKELEQIAKQYPSRGKLRLINVNAYEAIRNRGLLDKFFPRDINESVIYESDEIQRNIGAINLILSEINWDGLCEIWVEYNENDGDYEIRSKSTKRHFDYDYINNELGYLDNTLRSMGLRTYIYTPWYVENCEDEVEFLNETKEETTNYVPIIEEIIEPFKNEDAVCEINVLYDEEDDMYSVYLVLGNEELNNNFFYVNGIRKYRDKLVRKIKTEIKTYLPIDNLYVGSYGKPNCGWSPLNENWLKVPSSEYNSLRKIINMEMKEKYSWWKDIKIIILNYIDFYGDLQIEAELNVDEEWGANQWAEFHYNTKFPGNKGWEDNDDYRRVSLGDIMDSTYAEVIRDNLREILRYALNIEAYNMSFRNVYLIFE